MDLRGNVDYAVIISFGNQIDSVELPVSLDITELTEEITISTSIVSNQPGRLEIITVKDSREVIDKLLFTNGYRGGAHIVIRVGGFIVFYGYLFRMVHGNDDRYTITAYDKLRYLANKSSYTSHGKTLGQVFIEICTMAGLNEDQYRIAGNIPEYAILKTETLVAVSYYQMINHFIIQHNEMIKDFFCLRDVAGTLTLQNVFEQWPTTLIGDRAFIFDYEYTHSIDDHTFNEVIIDTNKYDKTEGPNPTNNKAGSIVAIYDEVNKRKWGTLSYYQNLPNYTAKQAQAYAETLLNIHNRPTERIGLSALGVTGAMAGSTIGIGLYELNLLGRWAIESSTHYLTRGFHTMDLTLLKIDE